MSDSEFDIQTLGLAVSLVGAGFRKPAPQIINALPLGSELILRAEPDNQHDPNAIAVYYDMSNFPVEQFEMLDLSIAPLGIDAHKLCSQGEFHLGYLAGKPKTAKTGYLNTDAIDMAEHFEWGFLNLHTTLGQWIDGSPTVVIRPGDHDERPTSIS